MYRPTCENTNWRVARHPPDAVQVEALKMMNRPKSDLKEIGVAGRWVARATTKVPEETKQLGST